MSDERAECPQCEKRLDDHTLRELREHQPLLMMAGLDMKAVACMTETALLPGITFRFVHLDGAFLPNITLALSERQMRAMRPNVGAIVDEALKGVRDQRKKRGFVEDARATEKATVDRLMSKINGNNPGGMADKEGGETVDEGAPFEADPDAEVSAEGYATASGEAAEALSQAMAEIVAARQANAAALNRLAAQGNGMSPIQILAMRLQMLAEFIMPEGALRLFELEFEKRLAERLAAQEAGSARSTLLQGVSGIDPRSLQNPPEGG